MALRVSGRPFTLLRKAASKPISPSAQTRSAAAHRPVILGTAGHIDHGKTALVRALTGIDADRLPEEQKRGMTIDLGFAHLELAGRQVGVIDVPGHERFIRNMVAGATGLDLVMLVIAADDGVMPQTREHLEIIDLLGVRGGIIALNKIDLVDEQADDPAMGRTIDGIRKTVAGTCLEGAPIIRVSATTGDGIQLLRDALEACIASADPPPWPSAFRLPIDRRFTLAGHGTVVTGSLLGGDVAAGDEVELMPAGRRLRVRNVQSHGTRHEGLASGRRVAVNVAGIKPGAIERGDELAAPGYLRPSERLAVRVRVLSSAPMMLETRAPVRLHIGTSAADARIVLLGSAELEPGQSAYALLTTDRPICATHGQRFIFRSAAYGVTIGGGYILTTCPPHLKLHDARPPSLAALDTGSDEEKLLAALELDSTLGADTLGLSRETGIEAVESASILSRLADEGRIVRSPEAKGAGFWTSEHIDRCKAGVLARLGALLERDRPRLWIDRSTLINVTAAMGSAEFIDWIVKQLIASGRLEQSDRLIRPPGYSIELGEAQARDLNRLIEAFESAGFSPPTPDAAIMASKLSTDKARPLLQFALDAGRLVRVNSDIFLTAKLIEDLRRILRETFGDGKGATISVLKDRLGVSRKYAVPICEFLDRKGWTRREGDQRFAGPKLKD